MHYTLGTVGNLYNFVYNSLLHLLGNSVDDGQVYRNGDPNTNGSTDPTHSQLAKDHDNHPFHTLAAMLAKYAVADVGTAIAAKWKGRPGVDPSEVAADYLVHPFDCTWQDGMVKTWAASHAAHIRRGESATEWEALRREHEKEIRDRIEDAGQRSKRTWDYLNRYYEDIFGEKNKVKK